MRTYSWMAKRLPGLSFAHKITVAGVAIVHLPLLAVIALAVTKPQLGALAISATALAATLVATVVMMTVLRGLLAPLQMAGTHLADYLAYRRLPPQVSIGNDEAGRLLHDVAISCAQIEDQRANLERLALQDPLTGINNRRAGEANLAQVGGPQRDQRLPLSVAVVDVDNLHEINADGGHAQGDEGLRRVAIELQTALRADDWVARWGGDEFLVVCHCTGTDMVTVMDRVRKQLATARGETTLGGQDDLLRGTFTFNISISIGVAELREAESINACIARADVALYAAKNQGRDSVRAAS